MGLCRCCELAQAPPDGLYCSRACAGRAAGAAAKAKREGTAGTTHDLRRGEEVLVHFPGQTAAQLHAVTGDWWPAVVRDFRRHYPSSDSNIRLWVLPSAEYNGWTMTVPVPDRRRLRSHPWQIRGLGQESWGRTAACCFEAWRE